MGRRRDEGSNVAEDSRGSIQTFESKGELSSSNNESHGDREEGEN